MIARRTFLFGGGAVVIALGAGGFFILDTSPASRRWVKSVVREHLAEGGLISTDLDRFASDFLDAEGTWKLEAFAAASALVGFVAPLERHFDQRIAEKKRQVLSYFTLNSDLFDLHRTGSTVQYFGLTDSVCQGANPFAQPIDAAISSPAAPSSPAPV